MQGLYGLPTESQEALNRRAHPGGGTETMVVESGEGLVEDQFEAHLKGLYVAYREPTAGRLAVLASSLEDIGEENLAEEVDDVLADFYEAGLVKFAVQFETTLLGIGSGLLGIATGLGPTAPYLFALYKYLGGELEQLSTDLDDLIDDLDDLADDTEIRRSAAIENISTALEAATRLKTNAIEMQSIFANLQAHPDRESATDVDRLQKTIDADLKTISDNLGAAAAVTTGTSEPMFEYARTRNLLAEVQGHISRMKTVVNRELSKRPPAPAPESQEQPAQPQAKIVAPVQTKNVIYGPKTTAALDKITKIFQEYELLKREVGEKRMVPEAAEKVRALQTPAFLGAMRNIQDNILPGIKDGSINPDAGGRPEQLVNRSIANAESQISTFFTGLDAIN